MAYTIKNRTTAQASGSGVNRPVRLDMTGEEFKTLVERRTQDGRIDTIPEVMEALSGMPDDKPFDEIINEAADKAVDDNLEAKSATSADIDEIFEENI